MNKTPVDIVLQQVKLPFEKLHDYQVEDINRLAPYESCSLFHGLGLGKTTIATMIGVYKLIEDKHEIVIVLCPESLIFQWQETLESMGLDVLAYRGTPVKRKKMNLDQDFLVMSYQIFQKDYERLKELYAYYVIDEAVCMCNPQNKLYKLINGGTIRKKVNVPGKLKPVIDTTIYPRLNRGVCLLSATPINSPINSYGWIETVNPGVYANFEQFKRIHVEEEDYFGQPIGFSNLDMIHENLMLGAAQRLVTDHIDLPPLVTKVVKYDLAPKHQKLYERLVRERVLEHEGGVIDAIQAMSLYNWLQKLILNPEEGGYEKDPVGLEILDGLVNSVDNFLSFGNYRMTNNKLMKRYNIGGVFGDVTSKQKQENIKNFKEGKLNGLACHPKSAGVGLDLPMCHNVLFPEIPVTPRDFLQACGRAYRQGQKEKVIVTVTVAKGTIQETLFRKFLDRDDLMAQVVNAERSLRDDLLGGIVHKESKKTKEELTRELLGK